MSRLRPERRRRHCCSREPRSGGESTPRGARRSPVLCEQDSARLHRMTKLVSLTSCALSWKAPSGAAPLAYRVLRVGQDGRPDARHLDGRYGSRPGKRTVFTSRRATRSGAAGVLGDPARRCAYCAPRVACASCASSRTTPSACASAGRPRDAATLRSRATASSATARSRRRHTRRSFMLRLSGGRTHRVSGHRGRHRRASRPRQRGAHDRRARSAATRPAAARRARPAA